MFILSIGLKAQDVVKPRPLTMAEYEKALRTALAAKEFRFLVAKVERDDTLPFTGNYIKRSERGMKESFVDALKRLPDYPGER